MENPMSHPNGPNGTSELRSALAQNRSLFWVVLVFSAFVNLLMLTGPLFMLQVYDRVLTSRSVETLAALFGLVLFLFVVMGVLDHARARIMTRIALRVQGALETRVFSASIRRSTTAPTDGAAAAALRDLDAIHRLLAAPTFLALFDAPWVPLFLAAIFIFHPWLGILAAAGALGLGVMTLLNQRLTAVPLRAAHGASARAERLADQLRDEAEAVLALGMLENGFRRWHAARMAALPGMLRAADLGGGFAAFTRFFRLLLQSAMLALGAWLVLRGELTAGAMIAASIVMGRALMPVEQVIAGWPSVARAREGWRRLSGLLGDVVHDPGRTALPRPRALLEVGDLTVVPPGQQVATLRMVSFHLGPGQALGVIGPSGAGKSTLARAICAGLRPAAGTIRLDGAALDNYGPDAQESLVGYLPQRVALFDGTIAENIARMSPAPDAGMVVQAAQKAAAHQMILALPDGYDTRVSGNGSRLSGGQIQRIGLARALYGNPVLLVLDEPNAHLDHDGSLALNLAVRAMKAGGGAVLIMAHRPAAITECDNLLVLEGGMRRAFGPRDEVLRAMTRNVTDIVRSAGLGG